jgi:hypothetical protein
MLTRPPFTPAGFSSLGLLDSLVTAVTALG